MATSPDDIIAVLDAFAADAHGGTNEERLNAAILGFNELPLHERGRVISAMFNVMERWPDADLGSPGPLVHAVESLPVSAYKSLLIASVRKQPGQLNIWMINRILNSDLDPLDREKLLSLLQDSKEHPHVSVETRAMVDRFLEYQAAREMR